MTTAPDLLPPGAAPLMVPDGGGALKPTIEDEDAAGYQAMMSELPTIVSMSGFLDGDFDELNEIQNLLAPVSDDDDEGHAAIAAAVAAEAAEEAYIQAMVPNPIPTGDLVTGMDVSATAAALDENLGFPSTALVTTTEINPPGSETSSASLSVKAPTKRVHRQVETGLVTPVGHCHTQQPQPKKVKRESPSLAQTPATLRTSLDGVSAPNPLLFGRPIQIPSQSKLDQTSPTKSHVTKVSLKPKAPINPTRAPQTVYPPVRPVQNKQPPKPRIPRNPLTPEIIASYPVPAFLSSRSNNRAPLCKVIFRGKIDPVLGSIASPIARVPAPPQKLKQLGSNSATCNPNDSATASKKKASNKKKKPAKLKRKPAVAKAKKVGIKPAIKTPPPEEGDQKKSASPPQPNKTEPVQPTSHTTKPSAARKMEELIVANPLANVPPAAPTKMPVPPKQKTLPPTKITSASKPQPAVVSSNSSAASETPEELPSIEVKKPAGNKPLTAEEKAQACRDRNRQHARNTRLRKKAYVEELKRSLMELVEQRDRDLASHQEEQTKKEQLRASRKKALAEFLQLRGHNEREEAKWAKLVKDSKAFRLTLPASKFQATVNQATATNPEQVLVGVPDLMADASYFASFLQSLGTTSKGGNEAIQNQKLPIYLQYHCDDSPLLMDGTTGILCWKATTFGAVSQGAKSELQLNGTIRAAFCSESDKLVSATLMFDTGVIQAQLSQSPHV